MIRARLLVPLAALGLALTGCGGGDDYRIGTGSTNADGVYEVTVYLDAPLEETKDYEKISRDLWTDHGEVHTVFKCESNDDTIAITHQTSVLDFTGRTFVGSC